ncbi:MAG: hypothetical protein JXX14_24685 [Deltaproteobacteria bacterium]|nr:hypothetical protein [Deltaproteobacteria bacterium]
MVASRALRTLQICVLTALCIACEPPADIRAKKNGELYPATVYRGSEILMKLSRSGTDFSACDSLDKWTDLPVFQLQERFVFTKDNSNKPISDITFDSLEHVGPDSISMRLNIGENIEEGYYKMTFACTRKQAIPARFYVGANQTASELIFNPPTLNAGDEKEEVVISLRDADGRISSPPHIPSSVIFYPDTVKITVDDVYFYEDPDSDAPPEMRAKFTVSDLALAIGESSRTIDVYFVDSPRVYSGKLNIEPDNSASVMVTPRRVKKPSAGDPPNVLNIGLEGKNISFIGAQSNDADWFSVAVPENPGVHVGNCQITTTLVDTAVCALTVDDSAFPGPTALAIKTGSETTYASITVVPSDFSDAMVRFWPPMIDNCTLPTCDPADVVCVRNNCAPGDDECLKSKCQPQSVVAKMIGATLDDTWRVTSSTPGAIIASEVHASSNHWILGIVADGAQVHNDFELTFSNGDREIHSHVLVRDIGGEAFRALETSQTTEPNARQNYSYRWMILNLQNTHFNSRDNISIFSMPRSGVGIDAIPGYVTDAITTPGQLQITNFAPAFDAPTGPSALQVNGETRLSENGTSQLWFRVDPAHDSTAHVTADPDVVWLGRSSARIVFKGELSMVLNESTQILLSDPSMKIANLTYDTVEVNNNGTLRLAPVAVMDLDISPAAIAGLKTFYFVNPDGQQAAVNIRGIKREQPIMSTIGSPYIYRRVGLGKISVPLPNTFSNPPLALSVFHNIGVSIERYNFPRNRNYFSIFFSLEEEGPGGWIGVAAFLNGERFVIPVKIIAENEDGVEDDSLTATLNREYIAPGGTNVEDLNIEMSAAIWDGEDAPAMGSMVSELHPLDPGVYARIENVSEEGGTSVRMTADFAHTLDLPSDQIYPGVPVSVSASDGAIVGFWKIHDEDRANSPENRVTVPVDEEGKDEVSYQAIDGGRKLIRGYFLFPPSEKSLIQIRGSYTATEQYRSAPLELLTSRDELDNRSVAVSSSQDGVLFAFADDVFRVWGNNSEPYTVTMIKTTPLALPDEGIDLCQTPWLTVDEIMLANEADSFEMLPASENCRLAVSVSARTLNDSPRVTPDVSLALCQDKNCDVDTVDGTAGSPDPTLYVDAADFSEMTIRAAMGTIGYYALNVRSPAIIQQVSLAAANPFIELRMEPGASMDGCWLQRLDPASLNPVMMTEQALSGIVPDNGRVYVAPSSAPMVTVSDNSSVSEFDIEDDFRIRLICNYTAMDELQVGGVKPPERSDTDTSSQTAFVDGAPLANYSAQCYRRIGNSIDTNRNSRDFVPLSACTMN